MQLAIRLVGILDALHCSHALDQIFELPQDARASMNRVAAFGTYVVRTSDIVRCEQASLHVLRQPPNDGRRDVRSRLFGIIVLVLTAENLKQFLEPSVQAILAVNMTAFDYTKDNDKYRCTRDVQQPDLLDRPPHELVADPTTNGILKSG